MVPIFGPAIALQKRSKEFWFFSYHIEMEKRQLVFMIWTEYPEDKISIKLILIFIYRIEMEKRQLVCVIWTE